MSVVVSVGVVVDAVAVGVAAVSALAKLMFMATVLAAMVASSALVGSGAAAITHCSLVQSWDPNTSFTTIVKLETLPLASAFLNVAPPLVLQSAGPT